MGVDSLITPKKLDGVTNVEMIIIFPALNFETEFKNIQSDDGKTWAVNILIRQEKYHVCCRNGAKLNLQIASAVMCKWEKWAAPQRSDTKIALCSL